MLRKYILVKKRGFSKPYSKNFNQLSKIRYTKLGETMATVNKFLLMIVLAMLSIAIVLLFAR